MHRDIGLMVFYTQKTFINWAKAFLRISLWTHIVWKIYFSLGKNGQNRNVQCSTLQPENDSNIEKRWVFNEITSCKKLLHIRIIKQVRKGMWYCDIVHVVSGSGFMICSKFQVRRTGNRQEMAQKLKGDFIKFYIKKWILIKLERSKLDFQRNWN